MSEAWYPFFALAVAVPLSWLANRLGRYVARRSGRGVR